MPVPLSAPPIGAAPPAPATARAAALREAATRAEGLLFAAMLRSAGNARLGPSSPAAEGDEDGAGEAAFTEMRDAATAEALARRAPLGLFQAVAGPDTGGSSRPSAPAAAGHPWAAGGLDHHGAHAATGGPR